MQCRNVNEFDGVYCQYRSEPRKKVRNSGTGCMQKLNYIFHMLSYQKGHIRGITSTDMAVWLNDLPRND